MKNSLNKYFDSAIFYALFFIAISFPLSYRLSNLGIVALLVFWLLDKIFAKKSFSYQKLDLSAKWILFSSIALFFWQLISVSWAVDQSLAWKNLEGKLSLVLFPLIIYDLSLNAKQYMQLLRAYVFSIGLCTIYLLGQSTMHYFSNGSFLTYHDFTRSLDFHAVFYSYYSFLAIILCFFFMRDKSINQRNKIAYIAVIVLSLVALLILASKNVLLLSLCSMLFLGIFQSIKGRIKLRQVLIATIALITMGFIAFQIPNIKNRLSELGQLDGLENLDKIKRGEMLQHEDRIKFNGTSLRLVFWYFGIERVVKEDKIWIGLNPADRRATLNKFYEKNGMNPAYENYNLHNQYIQTFVELGLIGLFLYVMINLGFTVKAWQNKNWILLIFIIAFTVFQMTESVLERNKGIVFFVFFLLFLQKGELLKHENRNTRN